MEPWQEFTAAMTAALAWPVATFLIVLLARGPIVSLIKQITEMSAFGMTAKFERSVSQTTVALAEGPIANPILKTEVSKEQLDLAARSPRAAILEGWVKIEKQLREKVGVLNPGSPRFSGKGLIEDARARDTIPAATANALMGLLTLRNLAAHSSSEDLTYEKAQEFLILSQAVEYVLNQPTRSKES